MKKIYLTLIALALAVAMFTVTVVPALAQSQKVDLEKVAGSHSGDFVTFNGTAGTDLYSAGIQASKELIQAMENTPAYQALILRAQNSGWTASQFTAALAQDKEALAQALSVQPALAKAQRAAWESETQLSTPITIYGINGVPYTITSPGELAYLGY